MSTKTPNISLLFCGNIGFKPIIDYGMELAVKFNYRSRVYDFGKVGKNSLGYGISYPKFRESPIDQQNCVLFDWGGFMLEVLEEEPKNQLLVLMTGDSLVVKPIDSLFKEKWDAAVCQRPYPVLAE